mgnify:CR=1 FL=1
MMKCNAVYGQSGGPTSVINASMYGVIKQCLKSEEIEDLYLMHNGINGLINDDLKKVSDIPLEQIELLPFTPSSIIGSIRHKLDNYEQCETEYLQILKTLKKYNIRYIFYNGGNDSMDTCHKLSLFLNKINYDCKVIGIPKTIDNDLMLTDHTPGFASSAKYIINTIQAIHYDNETYPNGRVNIVEIMGRDTGWLCASASLASISNAGPDLVYLPEVPFDIENFLNDVKEIYNKQKRCLVVVSEGIKDREKNLIQKIDTFDEFNHFQLGGVCHYLSNLIEKNLHFPTRAIELSLPQRCYSYSGSKIDVEEAIKCGQVAVKTAIKGISNIMIAIKRTNDDPYQCEYINVPLNKVANGIKRVPDIYINKKGNNINSTFISYCLPLIQGEITIPIKNGIYHFAEKKYF